MQNFCVHVYAPCACLLNENNIKDGYEPLYGFGDSNLDFSGAMCSPAHHFLYFYALIL